MQRVSCVSSRALCFEPLIQRFVPSPQTGAYSAHQSIQFQQLRHRGETKLRHIFWTSETLRTFTSRRRTYTSSQRTRTRVAGARGRPSPGPRLSQTSSIRDDITNEPLSCWLWRVCSGPVDGESPEYASLSVPRLLQPFKPIRSHRFAWVGWGESRSQLSRFLWSLGSCRWQAAVLSTLFKHLPVSRNGFRRIQEVSSLLFQPVVRSKAINGIDTEEENIDGVVKIVTESTGDSITLTLMRPEDGDRRSRQYLCMSRLSLTTFTTAAVFRAHKPSPDSVAQQVTFHIKLYEPCCDNVGGGDAMMQFLLLPIRVCLPASWPPSSPAPRNTRKGPIKVVMMPEA